MVTQVEKPFILRVAPKVLEVKGHNSLLKDLEITKLMID